MEKIKYCYCYDLVTIQVLVVDVNFYINEFNTILEELIEYSNNIEISEEYMYYVGKCQSYIEKDNSTIKKLLSDLFTTLCRYASDNEKIDIENIINERLKELSDDYEKAQRVNEKINKCLLGLETK